MDEFIKKAIDTFKNYAFESEDLDEKVAEERLWRILQKGGDFPRKWEVDTKVDATMVIEDFLKASKVKARQLLLYSKDFYDPTEKNNSCAQEEFSFDNAYTIYNGASDGISHSSRKDNFINFDSKLEEEIQLQSFLGEDELLKLYNFVKAHENDNVFSVEVYKFMQEHGGLKAPEVYKRAMMSRQDFNRATDMTKTRNVTRRIAWQIIVGLQCTLEEADKILFSAGFARGNNCLDMIVSYFIEHGNYDIMAINEMLVLLGQKPFPCYLAVRDSD